MVEQYRSCWIQFYLIQDAGCGPIIEIFASMALISSDKWRNEIRFGMPSIRLRSNDFLLSSNCSHMHMFIVRRPPGSVR